MGTERETARARLGVPGVERELDVIRYGHWGRPVLVFPAEGGRPDDVAERGLVDAVGDLLDAGRVSLFCVGSLDDWSWSNQDLPTEERARRHGAYHAWIVERVVPWIYEQVGQPTDLLATGVSMGAYHAVQFALQRADLAPVALGLSGAYDASAWRGWGDLGDATYFANPAAYVPNLHGDHLDWLRSRLRVVLVAGQGPFEVSPTNSLPSTVALAQALQRVGITTELDVWGHDSAHDWPWWGRQLAHHLPRFC